MRLDRDQFVISYDGSKADTDTLMATIKVAGYESRIVTDAAPDAPSIEVAVGDDPGFFTEALARARQEGKPVVIDFHASWCQPCQQMIKETFPDPKVVALLQRCVFLKIDTDLHPATAKRFGVAGLPDIRILAPDGSEQKRIVGFQDAHAFSKALAEVLGEADR